MKLKIVSVYNHGDLDKEHVVLNVLEDCNLNAYVLMDTTYDKDGNVSNKHRHVKWLPSAQAKKGDKVSVWTKEGSDKSVTSDGTRWHRVYWNMNTSIWNSDGDVAVLAQVSGVDRKSAQLVHYQATIEWDDRFKVIVQLYRHPEQGDHDLKGVGQLEKRPAQPGLLAVRLG